MRNIYYSMLALLLLASCGGSNSTCDSGCCSTATALIPKPQSIEITSGKMVITDNSRIGFDSSDSQLADIADYINQAISPALGYSLETTSSKGQITLKLEESTDQEREAYSLKVTPGNVTITASSYHGIFNGVTTLLQLMPQESCSPTLVEGLKLEIPCCEIEDAPAFVWRGAMLDVSRHWFTKEEVMRYIDQIARYKMNIFHWHLTDDQGWRIEIKSRPELTNKGALRAERVGKWWTRQPQQPGEEATYGGYYTQEDIKEVVEYAAKRYITIVPEIDVPGHSLSSLVAYPELACYDAPTAINVGNKFYGEDPNALCAGNPESYKFMEDVLSEVAALFPSEYIHIGGDECNKTFWKRCPKCQALMRKEALKDEHELQSYFIRSMEKIVKSHGKKLIGWDEILEGGLAEDATVMAWLGFGAGGVEAAKQHHYVIMTPFRTCYLDLYQGDSKVEPDTYHMARLSNFYEYKPIPDELTNEEAKYILGGQANLWAESVPHIRQAEYMTWPRSMATAEILWYGQDNKDWNNFVSRVERHFERLDAANINHALSVYNAIITPENRDNKLYINLSTEIEDLDIYYTFDNTDPDIYTSKYSEPLTVPTGATWLRVVTYRGEKPIGKVITYTIKELEERVKINK